MHTWKSDRGSGDLDLEFQTNVQNVVKKKEEKKEAARKANLNIVIIVS